MKEGWLEDHLGLLTNHHISLMQGEVDRYQETCKLLKDYYVGMEGGLGQKKGLPIRLFLLQLHLDPR